MSAGKHADWVDPQYDLKKFNELFAAWVKESVRPYPAKSLWQYMEHEQVKKFLSAHGFGFVCFRFGGPVAKGHLAVFTSQDVLFPNNSPIEIIPKIYDGLVAVANVFTMSYPFFGAISGYFQALINQGFQHLCPKNPGQSLFIEKVSGLFLP